MIVNSVFGLWNEIWDMIHNEDRPKNKKGQDRNPARFKNPLSYEKPL